MKKEKREAYLKEQYISFHTFGISAQEVDMDAVAENEGVKASKGKSKYSLIINPNKSCMNQHMMLETYKDTKYVLDWILNVIDAKDAYLNRADLSINSDKAGDFELYCKLNKLILCCLSVNANTKNNYEARDLWTRKKLNTAIKGIHMEAENYDKQVESHGSVPTTNRLELRSVGLRKNGMTIDEKIREEFLNVWIERLNEVKSKETFDAVQTKYNEILAEEYLFEMKKEKKDRTIKTMSEFLRSCSDCIFTSRQMADLIERISDTTNPTKAAKKFKEENPIEYFSLKDLQVVIDGLKRNIKNYFEKTPKIGQD